MNGMSWMLKKQPRELSGLSLGIKLSSPALDRSAGSGQDACLSTACQAPVIVAAELSFLGLLSHVVGRLVSEVPTLAVFAVQKRKRNSTIHVLLKVIVIFLASLFAKLPGLNPVFNEL